MFNFRKPSHTETLMPHEAHDRACKSEICLVDVREANEWAQMRVPGAVHAPLSSLAARLDTLPSGKPVVFYCQSGLRSAKAIEICRALGKPHNTHVSGGISAWRSAGLPVDA